jgi:PTS system mannose-specific IID component
MQNLAVMRALGPALAKLDGGDSKSMVSRHLEFFNCNPNFVPVIVGGVLRLEEERAAGRPVESKDIAYFKRAVSGPLAAMGDMLFLGGLKPLSLTLACIFAIYKSFIGLLAIILLYNAMVVSCRLWGVYFGYSKGWALVDVFSGPAFQRLLGIVQSVGASVGGALVAVVVHRLPQDSAWFLPAGVALIAVAVFTLRRDISSSRLAVLLFPLSALIGILL